MIERCEDGLDGQSWLIYRRLHAKEQGMIPADGRPRTSPELSILLSDEP